jgi:hypothetical protein
MQLEVFLNLLNMNAHTAPPSGRCRMLARRCGLSSVLSPLRVMVPYTFVKRAGLPTAVSISTCSFE